MNNYTIPLYVYTNPYIQRNNIYKDNLNKAGIYRWINKKSGKCYIGSSLNINRRIRDYLNKSYLSTQIKKK
jgi:excinuclease UvrABC nuclease subunit